MENKRKNIYIVIFVITTIIASCVAVYFGIVEPKQNEELKQEINELSKKNNTSVVEEIKVTEERAKEVIEGCLNISMICRANPTGILCSKYLGYYNSYEELKNNIEGVSIDSLSAYKTNIEYQDFKNKMLQYMSVNLFETDTIFQKYININGSLYILDGGSSSGDYTIKNVKQTFNDGKYVKYDFNGTLEGMNGSVGEFKGAATLLEENEKIVVDSFKILN